MWCLRNNYLEPVPKAVSQSLCLNPLSENFVEIGHFQRNFDKVFRQRSTTKLGMSLLGQALATLHRYSPRDARFLGAQGSTSTNLTPELGDWFAQVPKFYHSFPIPGGQHLAVRTDCKPINPIVVRRP